ncbi:MAG: sialidase family protein [Planctomycetota bacterium]
MGRAIFYSLIAVLLVSSVCVADEIGFMQVDVFKAGELGYKEFRIPSLVVTKSGTILAFTEAGWTSADAGDRDIKLRRSTDGGRTWTKEIELILDRGKSRCGSPATIVEAKTGRIHLITAVDSKEALHSFSDDDAVTWSELEKITYVFEKFKPRYDWTGFDTGPAKGIELSRGKFKGRFIQPMWLTKNNKAYRSGVIYSDDRGVTWKSGGLVREAELNTNECSVYEAADGTLWMNTQCLASTLRYSWPEEGRGRVLFANPADERSRVNMTVRMSYDDGRSWPVAKQIYAGPSAYSCMVRMPNGDIGLLYECGEKYKYEKMAFTRFTLGWLTEGKDKISCK